MNVLLNILVVLIWLLLIPINLLQKIAGKDTLQLRRPVKGSCWLTREKRSPTMQSYFSQKSEIEGRDARREGSPHRTTPGVSRWLAPLLAAISRLFTPKTSPERPAVSAADRDEGIPDEVYTLW